MIIIVYLLFISAVVGSKTTASGSTAVGSPTTIDPINDQSAIDGPWIDYMITAPATINLLGQVMVVASVRDVSFETYSPNHVYKYIKYPNSLRATLLQISNEGYRAFLGAHSTMNQIQSYMKQIPGHMETISKIASSKASARLVSRMIPRSIQKIERIGATCVELARSANHSFSSVLYLLHEVVEIVQVTKGRTDEERHKEAIEANITRQAHAEMKQHEEELRQHQEEIRKIVRQAQNEYSQALKDIPTGFKALVLDLGRTCIKLLAVGGQAFIAKATGGASLIPGGGSGKGEKQSLSSVQIITFASRFSESLDNLIQKLSKNENQTRDIKELKGYKVIFTSYSNLLNMVPQSDLKTKAVQFIQRAIGLVDSAIKDKNAVITDKLQALAAEVKPFMAAEQLSSTNNAPISVPSGDDSSKNELLKAKLSQQRLAQVENRLDAQYERLLEAAKHTRELSGRLARLDLNIISLDQIIQMLKEAFELLGKLQKNWSELVLFFSGFANQVVTGFGEKLTTFVSTAGSTLDAEESATDRQFILQLLSEDSGNLYHESYILYVLSRTYYDVSSKYLMPRLSGLQLMLATSNDNERKNLLSKLGHDTEDVQDKVKQLIEERRRMYKKEVNKKRALLNEVINDQGADGDEEDIIKEAKLLGITGLTTDEDYSN